MRGQRNEDRNTPEALQPAPSGASRGTRRECAGNKMMVMSAPATRMEPPPTPVTAIAPLPVANFCER
jgi:hypothetical protein